MFSYLKNVWYEEEGQTPTIEDLLKLCKAGEVKRVIIPNTYYGYGSTLVDTSNLRSIQKHYNRSRFTMEHYSLTMSAQQFIRNEDYREFIEDLQEQSPLFNDEDYFRLEHETKLEHLVDEISYVLINDDSYELFELLPNTLYEVKALVTELLEDYRDDNNTIEWWEHVEIDNDGATPYATEAAVKELTELVKIKWEATK